MSPGLEPKDQSGSGILNHLEALEEIAWKAQVHNVCAVQPGSNQSLDHDFLMLSERSGKNFLNISSTP